MGDHEGTPSYTGGRPPPGPSTGRSEAWGGASRIQPPPTSLRETMQEQFQSAGSGQVVQQQLGTSPSPSVTGRIIPQTLDAQGWLQEARKIRPDAITGQLQCRYCSRVLPDCSALAQHLQDKHGPQAGIGGGSSTSPGPFQNLSVSLADLLMSKSKGSGGRTTSSAAATLTARQMRSVKGLVQAFPTKRALAEALKERRVGTTGKKKMSRLKRIILRERANKAVADATAAAEAAATTVQMAHTLRDNIKGQLQFAGEALMQSHKESRVPDPSAITHLQVLEVAAAEIDYRVAEAETKAQEAQVELARALAEQASFSKAPKSSEALADVEEPVQGTSDPSEGVTPAVEASQAPSKAAATDQSVSSQQIPASQQGASLGGGDTGASHSVQMPRQQPNPLSDPYGLKAAAELESIGSDSVDGLDDFEDVLATWLHSAHERTVSAYPSYMRAGQQAQEEFTTQVSQQTEEAPAQAAPATEIAPEQLTEKQKQIKEGKRPMSEAAEGFGAMSAALEEFQDQQGDGSDDDAEILGPDDWDDILSAWMGAAGLSHAIPRTSWAQQTDISQEGESETESELEGGGISVQDGTESSRGASLQGSSPPDLSAVNFPGVDAPKADAGPAAAALRLTAPPLSMLPRASVPYPRGDARPQPVKKAEAGQPGSVQAPAKKQPPQQNVSAAAAGQPPLTPEVPDKESLTRFIASSAAIGSQRSSAGRPFLNVVPPMDQKRSESLPMLGVSPPVAMSSALRMVATPHQAGPSQSSPSQSAAPGSAPEISPADVALPASGSKPQEQAPAEQKAAQDPQAPALQASAVKAPPSQPMVTKHLEDTWHAHLQGQFFTVEEMLEQGMVAGDESPTSRTQASSPNKATSSVEQSSAGLAEQLQAAGPSGSAGLRIPSAPQSQQQALSGEMVVDVARQQALENILRKHSAALLPTLSGGSVDSGPYLPLTQQPLMPPGPTLVGGGQQEGLTGPQFNQLRSLLQPRHQGGLRPVPNLDLQSQPSQQGMGMEAFLPGQLPPMPAMPHFGEGFLGFPGQQQAAKHQWPGASEHEPGSFGSHEFTCEVCGITCCGLINFEQHCTSKRHLRRAAAAANALAGGGAMASDSTDTERNTTYVGLQAQCRNYCKQVITTELNRAVVELLQQLLFWQERAKAASPYNAAKHKRLVSGLREVAKAVRMRKACTVVVAPNVEQIESEGGLDDLLSSILTTAEVHNIPIVFALSRKKLGQMFGCRKKMSAIAILDFSGAEAIYHHMESLAQQGRLAWIQHHGSSGGGGASSSSEAAQQLPVGQPPPQQDSQQQPLYRLRPDGRQVSITKGHGHDYARGKGALGLRPASGSGGLLSASDPVSVSAFQPQEQQRLRLHQHFTDMQQQQQQRQLQAAQLGRLLGQQANMLGGAHMGGGGGFYTQQGQQQRQQQQAALAPQLSGLHLREGSAAGGYDQVDMAAASSGLAMPGMMPGLDLTQHGSGGVDPISAFQAQGAAFGEALFGQGYAETEQQQQQQLPFNMQDSRFQGPAYSQQWQNQGQGPDW